MRVTVEGENAAARLDRFAQDVYELDLLCSRPSRCVSRSRAGSTVREKRTMAGVDRSISVERGEYTDEAGITIQESADRRVPPPVDIVRTGSLIASERYVE